MTEIVVLLIFAAALILCIALDWSILIALVFGYFVFCAYALFQKHKWTDVLKMTLSGMKTVKNILITFLLIGMITAAWRASGTIPYIVYHSTKFCSPQTMVLASFLLCCLISFLTGTAFGTSATIGVICAAISNSMGISPVLSGGAILAGSYFGDRCSPMSTSALLVSTLTGTDFFGNLKEMLRTCVVPFLISCVIYFFLGSKAAAQDATEVCEVFARTFTLSPLLLLPAVAIIVLSLFRVNVKITMSVSIVLSVLLALFLQDLSVPALLKTLVLGYRSPDPSVQALLSGGGVLSMLNVVLIVFISSGYAGIFKGTGLLNNIKGSICTLSEKITPFGGVLFTAVITSMVTCNQTLSIMLSCQLCEETVPEKNKLASYLENTAVIIAPLIPWSVASAVNLSSVNAPKLAIVAACYLYLLPLWNYLRAFLQHKRKEKAADQKNPN